MAAKSATSFLLAFLKNASALQEIADDLRGEAAKLDDGARREAPAGSRSRVAWEQVGCIIKERRAAFLPDGTRG